MTDPCTSGLYLMKKGKYDKNPAIFFGKGHTNAFGVYIGHKICHRVPATSATLLSRPAITMSEGPEDQKSRCPASKQVISCPMAVK